MYARRLLLAAVVVAAFTLVAQQQVGAALSDATTAAPGGSARLDQAHARTASIDGKRLDITKLTGFGSHPSTSASERPAWRSARSSAADSYAQRR